MLEEAKFLWIFKVDTIIILCIFCKITGFADFTAELVVYLNLYSILQENFSL